MLKDKLEQIADWLPFAVGLLAGVALAFFIYAGLQPRLEKTVLTQQALKAKAEAEAAMPDTAGKAKALALAPAKLPKPAGTPPVANAASALTPAAANDSLAAGVVRLTTLAPSSTPANAPGRRPWLAVGLVMAVALTAGAAAWQQFRQQPQPPGAITSPVLEALFTLRSHRDIMQQTLGLSPRQIKRFSSKARVQHSQLRAQAHPGAGRTGIAFPVDFQIKAFQLLLLLEENRKLPQRFPQDDAAGFIGQMQAAYIGHPELTGALQEANAHPVIMEARAREGFLMPPDFAAEERFLRQLYEMNVGLLA